MSENNERYVDVPKYAYGGLVPDSDMFIGTSAFKREFEQHCDPGDDPYNPFKWSHLLANARRLPEEKDRLGKIEESLKRIEKKINKLTGPQLINGVWR